VPEPWLNRKTHCRESASRRCNRGPLIGCKHMTAGQWIMASGSTITIGTSMPSSTSLIASAGSIRSNIGTPRSGPLGRIPPSQRLSAIACRATGRTHEPHDQGSHRQALPLRRSRPAAKSPRQLYQRLQFRTKVEALQSPNALRVHLQTMDNRTLNVHPKPNPSNAGTEHLGR
jgi:hypothetical protein